MQGYQNTIVLWRPVGPEELELIRQSGMLRFPPCLPEQPIFQPVLSEDYAIKIARDWNVLASGSGYVTRFRVKRSFLGQYQVQEAGGRSHLEYWIPADDLDAFNNAIVGYIEVVASFTQHPQLWMERNDIRVFFPYSLRSMRATVHYPGKRFYCWHCALIEGVLASFPDLTRLLNVERIAWSLLVLAEGQSSPHQTGIHEGRAFVADKDMILAALAERHGFPDPHP